MKSKRALDFLDGKSPVTATASGRTHYNLMSRLDADRAVKLAEQDARGRAKRAFCLQVCGTADNAIYKCECVDFYDFLSHYDNE